MWMDARIDKMDWMIETNTNERADSSQTDEWTKAWRDEADHVHKLGMCLLCKIICKFNNCFNLE